MDTSTNYVMDVLSHSPSAFIFGACCVFYLVIYPLIKYYQDPKGMFDKELQEMRAKKRHKMPFIFSP